MGSLLYRRCGPRFLARSSERVCDILGSDLTINFNNNGWGAEIQALTFSRNMANYRNGNLWGTSDQPGGGRRSRRQSLPLWEDGSVRWTRDGVPMDMAPELLASFALETFRRGGCLVQIEPPATLFEPAPTTSIPNNLKRKQYGPTIAYKVFEDLMLNYTSNASAYPSMDPADYYVLDRGDVAGQPLERQTEEIRPDDHHLDRGQGGR